MKSARRQTVINILFSVVTVWAFSMKLDIVELPEGQPQILYLARSFRGYSVLQVIAVPVLYHFYQYINDSIIQAENKRERVAHSVLAMVMSAFMLLGYSYEKSADWNLVVNIHKLQWLKALITFLGYYALWDKIFAWMLSVLSRKEIWFAGEARSRLDKWLSKHTCAKIWTILMLGLLPYIICSYPATVVPDTITQIVQSYNQIGQWTPYYYNFRHLSDSVYLNAHHPVVHTLLIHGCMETGKKCFGSYNGGLFMYALMQAVFQISIFSAAVSTLVKIKVKWYWILLVILYYVVSPGIVSYVMLGTKDTFYASFTLLFILAVFDMLCNGEKKRNNVYLYLSSLGMVLFRNDGKYVLIVSIAVMAIFCKSLRKNMVILFIGILMVSTVYSELLLPAFSITSGSRREMLSIPFQQTARYVRDASDGVTQEERNAIDAVLDYDHIAGKYDPERSDNVKGTYNELASTEELYDYLKAWVKMFFKHPSHYLQATLNNYYYYFYPGERRITVYKYSSSGKYMDELNERAAKIGMDIHYPAQLNKIRERYELIINEIVKLPIVSAVMSASTYTWVLLLVTGYVIAHRIKKAIPLIAVPFVVFLVCLAGPCNGWYYRYLYPVAASLPLIHFTALHMGSGRQ